MIIHEKPGIKAHQANGNFERRGWCEALIARPLLHQNLTGSAIGTAVQLSPA